MGQHLQRLYLEALCKIGRVGAVAREEGPDLVGQHLQQLYLEALCKIGRVGAIAWKEGPDLIRKHLVGLQTHPVPLEPTAHRPRSRRSYREKEKNKKILFFLRKKDSYRWAQKVRIV